MKTNLILASAFCAAVCAAPAAASIWPNFVFPSGDSGFLLRSLGAAGCPCDFTASFGPSNGDGLPSALDLTSPTAPTISNSAGAGTYTILFSLADALDSKLALPDAPSADGFTGFHHQVGGHSYDVSLHFGPGQVSNWAAFAPRSSPSGAFFGATFDWAAPQVTTSSLSAPDAFVTINVAYDGQPVGYTAASAPEPEAWALMLAGFGIIGGMVRRRRAVTA